MKKIGIYLVLILTVFLIGCKDEGQLKDVVKVDVVFNGNAYVSERLEESLDKFIVHAYDSLGKKKQILVTKDMVSGFDTSTSQSIDVSVKYKEVVGTTKINVVGASFLYADFYENFDGILYEDDKVEEFIEKFSLAVLWNDNRQDTVKVTKDMISGFDVNVPGKKEVFVNYGGEKLKIGVEVLKLVDFDVTIDESITYFEYQPIEHFYEAFNIVGRYSNGEEREVEAKRINITATENIVKDGEYDVVSASVNFVFEKNGKKIERKHEGHIELVNNIELHTPYYHYVNKRSDIIDAESYLVTLEYYTNYDLGFNNEYMYKHGYVADADEISIKFELLKEEIEIDRSNVEKIHLRIKGIEGIYDSIKLEHEENSFVDEIIDGSRYIKYIGIDNYLILPYYNSHTDFFGNNSIKNTLRKIDYENLKIESIYIDGNIDIIEDGAFAGSLDTIKYIYIDGYQNFDLEKIFGGVLPNDVVIGGYNYPTIGI